MHMFLVAGRKLLGGTVSVAIATSTNVAYQTDHQRLSIALVSVHTMPCPPSYDFERLSTPVASRMMYPGAQR